MPTEWGISCRSHRCRQSYDKLFWSGSFIVNSRSYIILCWTILHSLPSDVSVSLLYSISLGIASISNRVSVVASIARLGATNVHPFPP